MANKVHKYTFLGYDIVTSNRTSKSHLLRFGGRLTLCGKDAGWSDWQHRQNAAPFDEATDCKVCLRNAQAG